MTEVKFDPQISILTMLCYQDWCGSWLVLLNNQCFNDTARGPPYRTFIRKEFVGLDVNVMARDRGCQDGNLGKRGGRVMGGGSKKYKHLEVICLQHYCN